MSDTSNTPPQDENGRPIFAETRASTRIPKTPTSGSNTLVPETSNASEPQTSGGTVAPATKSEETTESEQPESSALTEIVQNAPKTKLVGDIDLDLEGLDKFASEMHASLRPHAQDKPSAAPVSLAPQSNVETSVSVAPAAPAAPLPPAADPALTLNFAPAPDAPFQSSVTVGITSHVAGARIFYTLDGTAPDENSTPYSPEKILLTQSATLSARAFSADKSGAICSADYIVSKPLWQEKEPADQTDPTPHKISDNLNATDNWQTAGASVRGKLHAHRALWREDAFALGQVGDWSAIVVSDGAGSAPLSRVGSNLACQSALADLARSLAEIEVLSDDINADLPRVKAALVGAGAAALGAIRDEAAKRSQPANAFAATLLVLVRRALGEAQLCAALQVGDGAIALDCASGLKLLGAADHGQHSSETRFLTTGGMEDDFVNRVKFSLPRDLRATLVVSDGVSDDYFPEDKRLTEVFEATLPVAQSADDGGAALLEWLGYEKKGSSDDRTLVLSWPMGSSDENNAVNALEAEISAPPINQNDVSNVAGVAEAMETRDGA